MRRLSWRMLDDVTENEFEAPDGRWKAVEGAGWIYIQGFGRVNARRDDAKGDVGTS